MRLCLCAEERRVPSSTERERRVRCDSKNSTKTSGKPRIENAIQYEAVDKLIKHWHTLEI